jgi:hypothetical protein
MDLVTVFSVVAVVMIAAVTLILGTRKLSGLRLLVNVPTAKVLPIYTLALALCMATLTGIMSSCSSPKLLSSNSDLPRIAQSQKFPQLGDVAAPLPPATAAPLPPATAARPVATATRPLVTSGARPPSQSNSAQPPTAGSPAVSIGTIPPFPWPPPAASAFVNISMDRLVSQSSIFITKPVRLREVEQSLAAALKTAGHYESGYYSVPRGFALVTKIERIKFDGTSMPGLERWDIESPTLPVFSLGSYLQALFTAPAGRYRVIVFVVTPTPYSATNVVVSKDEATKWLLFGGNQLPEDIGSMAMEPRTSCTAMIYEFKKGSAPEKPHMLRPGQIPATFHISGTGLGRLIQ